MWSSSNLHDATQHTLFHFKAHVLIIIHLICLFPRIPNSVRPSGDADSETAALGYFVTPCVGTLVTLFSYLLLPRLVSQPPALHD